MEAKNNMSFDHQSCLSFEMTGNPEAGNLQYVQSPSDLTYEDFLNHQTSSCPKLDDCVEWVEDYIGKDKVSVKEMIRAGKNNGHSEKTIKRARKELNVGTAPDGKHGEWMCWIKSGPSGP